MRCFRYDERFAGAELFAQGTHIERLAEISAWLRKKREFSFYGDIDFIPTEEYSREDAERAMQDAQFVVAVAEQVIGG